MSIYVNGINMENNDWVKEPILLEKSDGKRHLCFIPCKQHLHGAAVDECFEDEKDYLFVSNGEYGSQVNFCPMCGYKAKKGIEECLN
jgi:hypothetical protein